MTATTLVKNPRQLIGTINGAPYNNAAGAGYQRASVDLRSAQGGLLTLKIANQTGTFTAQAVANVMIAHSNSASTPTLGAAGNDWKTIASFGGGVTASTTTEWSIDVPPGVMWLQVEMGGNTGAASYLEAHLSEITNASTT